MTNENNRLYLEDEIYERDGVRRENQCEYCDLRGRCRTFGYCLCRRVDGVGALKRIN